jgi:predicted amidohydrolase
MTKFLSVTWVLFILIISPCLLSTAANAQITEPDFFHIDLRDVTNMEFYDQISDDQKGGWIDMGPTHSFEAVPYGVFTFQDGIIPFNIIDPAENDGTSVLVLNGPKRETSFMDQSKKIPVNRKLKELYFLHTSMYAESSADCLPLVKYRIHYEDGSEHLFICYEGLEIDDCWDPSAQMPRAIRTYQEGMKWFFNTPWLNPLPDKTIQWIRMESTGNAIPALIAITGSSIEGPFNALMALINEGMEQHKTGILRIALVQPASDSDQELNLKRGEEYCRQAREMGADIVLFPELYNIGYSGIDFNSPGAIEKWNGMAISSNGPFVKHFQQLAKELDLAIHMTYLEQWKGLPKNSASLIDRHGEIILNYSKVHTCDFVDIELHTTPGDKFSVAELDTRLGPVKIGSMICYDREHPESARLNMLAGAEIILTPNACNLSPMLIKQFQVRAFENALVTGMANYAQAGMDNYNGRSCLYGADGEEIWLAGADEGLYVTEINLAEIRNVREKTIYGNAFRRPHKYGPLVLPGVEPPFIRDNASGTPFIRMER